MAKMYPHAKQCFSNLGELGKCPPLLQAALSSPAHDVCQAHRDKDNRAILRFPPHGLENVNVGIVSGGPSFRFTANVYQSLSGNTNWVILISYRNHMRLIVPPMQEYRGGNYSIIATTLSFMIGWGGLPEWG